MGQWQEAPKRALVFFVFFERQKLHINVLYWLVNLILKYNCVQCSIGSIGVTLQFIWDCLIVVIPSCNTSLLAINGQQKLDIFLQKWSFLPFFFFFVLLSQSSESKSSQTYPKLCTSGRQLQNQLQVTSAMGRPFFTNNKNVKKLIFRIFFSFYKRI